MQTDLEVAHNRSVTDIQDMPGKRTKRVLRSCLWLVLVVVVIALTMPLWFPWVLRPGAKRFGVTFRGYERLSYSRFAVTGAIYTNRNVRVHAKRLEVAPLSRRATAEDWSVVINPSGRKAPNAPASVHNIYQRVSKIVSNVQHWIPQAALTNGYVQTPKVAIHIPGVAWDGPNLSGQAQISNALPLTTITAKISGTGPLRAQLLNPSLELQSIVTISNTPEGLRVQAANRWRTNEFSFTASFGTRDKLPAVATINARPVVFPPVKGGLDFIWEEGRYVLRVDGTGLTQPIEFNARVTGDTNSAEVQSAELAAPWARAQLQASVPLSYARPFLASDARFSISADLSRQPWVSAKGMVDGQVTVHPTLHAELSLAGRNIEAARMRAGQVHFTGALLLSNLAHSGSVVIQAMTAEPLNPMDLAMNWSGKKLALTNIWMAATAGESAISVAGAANFLEKHFEVTQLALGTNQADFSADVRWPDAASICAQATNLSARALGAFAELPYDDVVLDHLRLAAGWTNGPLVGRADFAARTLFKDGTQLSADAAVMAHAKGLTITNITLSRGGEPVSAAHGVIPFLINPAGRPLFVPLPGEALQAQLTAHPQAFFWKVLENKMGIGLREPDVRAELSGTWEKPNGRLSARAEAIQFRHARPEVPPIEALALVAHIHADAAEIEFLNFFVTNQPVTFSARMPLPENFWSLSRTNASPWRGLDWRELSCRLRIDQAQIAAFVPLASRFIAPQGTIDADLGLARGGKLEGELRIDGAATRPVGALGALQDVDILCQLAGEEARVNSHARLGGQPVLGAGEVRLEVNHLFRKRLPPFQWRLAGENVPLMRQPDAVVRADLDVTIKHTAPAPAVISGKLHLRDGLYLRELRDLVPGRLASAERRPPYFRVAAQPFAGWRLDLAAAGRRFLKVRTPIFNGEISADLKLSGALFDPVAIGDVMIDAGVVRFPFGSIPINQGIISLTSDNPYRPQLLITGNARVYGYDINMEVTGYADAPVLQFSSTPPLSSEQILLMLTAGEIPRQGQFAFSAEQRAQRLALFLGRGVLTDLGIAGDGNRLTIHSGEHMTETGRPTYSVEYELTEDWSVLGQYDRFNDFNLMLKWRVYSR